MRKQRLSDLLFRQKPKWTPYREEIMKPPPIGHHVAIQCYENGFFRDTLFADDIVVNPHSTRIIYNQKEHLSEVYVAKVNWINLEPYGATVYYDNNTYFEIMRIS